MNKSKKLDDFEKVQELQLFVSHELISKTQSFQFAEFKNYTASTFFLSPYGKFMTVYTK